MLTATATGTSTAGPAALELRGLSRSFGAGGDAVQALADVSLRVAPGEFVSLLGPSGCGKSTLLNLIAGLDEGGDGEILVDGARLPSEDRLAAFGYMPQQDLLFPWRSVLDNVALGLEIQGAPRAEARRAAAAHFERFGLAGFERRRPFQLSGGMRQRAAFLRTYLLGRPFLLLDEPFGALDAITRSQLHGWFAEVWAEACGSALLVTHDPSEAVALSDRVYLMSARPGRIAAEFEVGLPRPRTAASAQSEAAHRLVDLLREQAAA